MLYDKPKKRPKVGDIIEIKTPKGFAYFQYILKNPNYYNAPLIRILPGIFEKRPKDFSKIAARKELFYTHFPLGPACWREIAFIVSNEAIPDHSRKVPMMRARGGIDKKGRVHNWWICDGDRKWRVNKLTEAQKSLSIREICNDSMLIHWIITDWKPENIV